MYTHVPAVEKLANSIQVTYDGGYGLWLLCCIREAENYCNPIYLIDWAITIATPPTNHAYVGHENLHGGPQNFLLYGI